MCATMDCIVVDSDEKYSREKMLKKEATEKKVDDKVRSKQDDAFTYIYDKAMSGECDRYVIHIHILCRSHSYIM